MEYYHPPCHGDLPTSMSVFSAFRCRHGTHCLPRNTIIMLCIFMLPCLAARVLMAECSDSTVMHSESILPSWMTSARCSAIWDCGVMGKIASPIDITERNGLGHSNGRFHSNALSTAYSSFLAHHDGAGPALVGADPAALAVVQIRYEVPLRVLLDASLGTNLYDRPHT